MVVDKEISQWEINFIKSIVSQLQLQFQTKAQNGEGFGVYKAMEVCMRIFINTFGTINNYSRTVILYYLFFRTPSMEFMKLCTTFLLCRNIFFKAGQNLSPCQIFGEMVSLLIL